MRAIRVTDQSESAEFLKFELVEIDPPIPSEKECLIEVCASGVNPSDVKALLGKMPYLTWPRTPGRDYAGVVIEGPSEYIGKEVWGTGGDLGMRRDGNHAQFALIDVAGVREKPKNISMLEAGSIGVSWTCAWLGMVKGSRVQEGETIVVFGANGKVGEASVQIGSGVGGRIISVERNRDDYNGHASGPVEVINLSKEADIQSAIMDRTNGRGADIIMNTTGSPYFEIGNQCLAKGGRQIIISTFIEKNEINLRTFYRGNHTLVGVSNMDHDHIVSGGILENLREGFENGTYKPYPIRSDKIFGLDEVREAYNLVLQDVTRDRVVINPQY